MARGPALSGKIVHGAQGDAVASVRLRISKLLERADIEEPERAKIQVAGWVFLSLRRMASLWGELQRRLLRYPAS